MNASSGLKAHKTLAPANGRYAKRQTMCGGNVRRERLRSARMTEIAASKGQTILFSGRGSNRQTVSVGLQPTIINGDTIVAKTQARIGRIEYRSKIRVAGRAGPRPAECIETVVMLALLMGRPSASLAQRWLTSVTPKLRMAVG